MVKPDRPGPGSVNRDPFETLQSSREPRRSQHQDGIPAIALSNIVSTASALFARIASSGDMPRSG
jgi:hypothetical protein